ncbi:MAG: hypothetical protein AAB365_00225 [Patescibacteria group bacterium]|mgnify:CR=1 FL=1
MKKIKTLVITRKTALPVAIQKCIEALGSIAAPHIAEVNKIADAQQLLKTEQPNLILIDGDYGLLDSERWIALSKLTPTALKLQLLENDRELPESLQKLKYLRALKEDGVAVGIFIDKPSEAVIKELGRLGATFVRPSLSSITSGEASFFQLIQGGKTVLAGLQDIGKALLPK